MTPSQFNRELNFQVSFNLAVLLFHNGLITDDELEEIRLHYAQEYEPIIGHLLTCYKERLE